MFYRFDVRYVTVINQLVLQIFNFYLVNKTIYSLKKYYLLSLDANINAQQTAAANQRLMFSTNNTPDLSTSSDNLFRNDCENPSNIPKTFLIFCSHPFSISDDLLNDNTNLSTVSLSSMIIYLILILSLLILFYSYSYYCECSNSK